jgi:hypothetical protein
MQRPTELILYSTYLFASLGPCHIRLEKEGIEISTEDEVAREGLPGMVDRYRS